VKQVSDVVAVGQAVKVKVIGMDDRGKVKLSMKVVDQATGEDISEKIAKEDAERRAARNAERQAE
jgi:polyribonucleotide nucleotidyltransferase